MKICALTFIAALVIPVAASAAPNDDTNKPIDTPRSGDTNKPADTAKPDDRPSTGDKTKAAKLADEDIRIVAHQHHVNMMEIDMGKLAKRVGGAAVKKYGTTLTSDHTLADRDLTALAKKHGLAKIPGDVASDERDAMMRIKKLKGPEFDREFISRMITGHEKEIERIDVDSAGARETELADLLRGVKPVLQRHVDAARELQRGQPTASK